MQQPTTITSLLRKLAAGLAATLALGSLASLGAASLTAGVAHADVSANRVSVASGVITVTGGPEDNHVQVSSDGRTYWVSDGWHDLTPAAPCVKLGFGRVSCPATGVTGVRIDSKAGDDWLETQAGNNVLIAGAGSDVLIGGSGNDDLQGGDGPDWLFGQAGNDKLDGGVGTTTSAGALTDALDYLSGGAGIDWVTYLAKTDGGVKVTLDGVANDGKRNANEQDNVLADVEDVTGTRFDDWLEGNDGENFLFGTWGFDVLVGWGGNDSLYGEDGPDSLAGGYGADSLYGGAGDDVLQQQFASPLKPDIDPVSDCGAGHDSLTRDSTEGLPTACEHVYLPHNGI